MAEHAAEGLSLLLPVCNQSGHLELVVSSWSTLLEKLERPYEFLLIDDGSTDATQKLIEGHDGKPGLAKRIPHLRVIYHHERRGFGACVREGIAESQHPLVFYTGCDFAYNPGDLRDFLKRIEHFDPLTSKKIDVVNGYRATTPITGWRKTADRIRRIFLRIALATPSFARPGWLGKDNHRFAFQMRALFGLRIGDVNSKFKLFRKKIFERIPIQSNGDFVHGEILAKANFLGCLMDEALIAHRPGPFPAHAEPLPIISRAQEMRRVFSRPDFGPPFINPATAAPAS
jgi:glycosyltransferase involved in cell wall biosynthesis